LSRKSASACREARREDDAVENEPLQSATMIKATVQVPVSEKLKALSVPTPAPGTIAPARPPAAVGVEVQAGSESRLKTTVRTQRAGASSIGREIANAAGLFVMLVVTSLVATYGVAVLFFD
jgi:hypothetical protein